MATRKTVLPESGEKPAYVNQMFAQIAPTYDLMNRLMTGGMDRAWRQEMLDFCQLPPHGRLLDVGTGTGDIAYTALRRQPDLWAVGSDFTYEMMDQGRRKATQHPLPFVQADALALPYPDDLFDAAVSGFLIRNVVDIQQAFREQARVVKPGGRVVCLEITPPTTPTLGKLFQFYFFRLVPLVGALVSGHPEAYAYLPQSTISFPEPARLEQEMERAGLRHVFHVKRMLGSVAIHVGTA